MLGTVPRHSIRSHLLSSTFSPVLRSTRSQLINPSSGGDTKFSHSAWMKWPFEPKNYQKRAHKLSRNACTWHDLVDQTFSWSVNKLARAVTKWTQACDRRLARLISYIHHTNDNRQYCHEGNTAQHCRLGLFKDSDFACDLDNSKSTLGGILHMSSEIN